MAAAPPKAGGNVLTRKLGPLPGWAWAAVGIGGFYLWKKRQAAAAAANTAATTSTASSLPYSGIPATSGAPSGYGYQGPGMGWGGSGPIPTGATAATSTFTPPTGETQVGAGYSPGTGGSTIVTGSDGNQYSYVPSGAANAADAAAGVQQFIQTAPGIFVPTTVSQMNGSGYDPSGSGTWIQVPQPQASPA